MLISYHKEANERFVLLSIVCGDILNSKFDLPVTSKKIEAVPKVIGTLAILPVKDTDSNPSSSVKYVFVVMIMIVFMMVGISRKPLKFF